MCVFSSFNICIYFIVSCFLLAHSMSLCNREASVVRLSVCLFVRLSVNFAQIATSTTEVAGSLPGVHCICAAFWRNRVTD